MHAPAALMSARRTSAVGALLVALGPISMALYTPAMPALVQAFQTDVSLIKLTLTVYFAGFAGAQLICGPLADAFGRRPVVLGFTLLYLAGSILAVVAPSVEWLLAARLVQGVGAAAGIAVSRAIVRDLFTGQESARVMNTIALMLAAGPALSPTIGGITLDLFGWRAIFLFMVLYGVLILAVFLSAVPETLQHRDPGRARPGRLAVSYARLLRDRRFLVPSIVIACTIGSLYAMATMLPFVLIEEAGLSPVQFGFGMLAQSGSFMLGSLTMRRLLRTIDSNRLVPVGLGLIGIGAGLLLLFLNLLPASFLTVMGPVALIAYGIAFVMPDMMTSSLAPFPEMAGAASALMGFLQMGGGLLGSGIAALMGEAVLALALIVPAMALIAIATYVAWGSGLQSKSEISREVGERRPAE